MIGRTRSISLRCLLGAVLALSPFAAARAGEDEEAATDADTQRDGGFDRGVLIPQSAELYAALAPAEVDQVITL